MNNISSKLATEMIKLLREAYGAECMAEFTIHKWHSTFSKNLIEAPLCEKKDDQPRMLITETNINIVWVVINDNRHLSTGALEALLQIHQVIIHRILTEKLVMVHIAYTWVLHMLIGDQMWISVESILKFLGHITEDSTYLNRVVTCYETRMHHYDLLTKWKGEHWKWKNEPQEKNIWQQKLPGKVMLTMFFEH